MKYDYNEIKANSIKELAKKVAKDQVHEREYTSPQHFDDLLEYFEELEEYDLASEEKQKEFDALLEEYFEEEFKPIRDEMEEQGCYLNYSGDWIVPTPRNNSSDFI